MPPMNGSGMRKPKRASEGIVWMMSMTRNATPPERGWRTTAMPMGMPADGMKGFSLSLMYPTVEEATRIFEALAEGGQVTMKPGKTFWSEYFGMATDRFGTPWMVNGGQMTS